MFFCGIDVAKRNHSAYNKILPTETHQSVGKESGQTNHMERWNNTLRQRNGRHMCKTLSFSTSDY